MSTITADPAALFRDGHLDDAVAAAAAAVRRDPADAGPRMLLAELLLFTGDFSRAETVLVAAGAADPRAALAVAEFRQLLRAAEARRQLARDGRVPDFIGGPTLAQTALLHAFVLLRDGAAPEALATAAREAEALRVPARGRRDGRAFDDLRDLDDLAGGNLEVLTTTGRFYWVPLERVESLALHPPVRPRDLFWRRCSLAMRDGPEGDVYLPAIYDAPDDPHGDGDPIRLGRATAWRDTGPVRGLGQRIFLVGDDDVPLHELGSIEFDPAAVA